VQPAVERRTVVVDPLNVDASRSKMVKIYEMLASVWKSDLKSVTTGLERSYVGSGLECPLDTSISHTRIFCAGIASAAEAGTFSVRVDVGELSRFSQRAPSSQRRRAEVVSGEKQVPHFVRNDKT
jgi:hypothetical protein